MKLKKTFILSLATGFGLGYSPYAPGTIGSIPGFLLVWACANMSWPLTVTVILITFFLGVWISNLSLKWFEEKDPGSITIDEIVSLPITFFLIPLSFKVIVIGFILNRILDIIKPPPAYQSQKLPKGWGIMVDDIISGIYSNLLLRVILIFLI